MRKRYEQFVLNKGKAHLFVNYESVKLLNFSERVALGADDLHDYTRDPSNLGCKCPYCDLWLDYLETLTHHLDFLAHSSTGRHSSIFCSPVTLDRILQALVRDYLHHGHG
jgi:hypothetical protein